MRNQILALAGAAALASSLAACGSSPPTATSVLQADGYSRIVSKSGLAAAGDVLPAKYQRYVSGYAVGFKPDNRAEVVMIVTAAGASTIPREIPSSGVTDGLHVSVSGDVVRLTGSGNTIESGVSP